MMSWASALQQPWVARLLARAVNSGHVSHAYLFTGTSGAGQVEAALDLAAALHCQAAQRGEICGQCDACRRSALQMHPDTYSIQPEGANIKREQVTQAQRWVALRPVTSPYRVMILQQAELMTAEAANAALKILEEPPAYAVFVLVAGNSAALLPTIRSRCQQIHFPPISPETIHAALTAAGVQPAAASMLAALSGGSLDRARTMASDPNVAERAREARNWLLGLRTIDDVDSLTQAEAVDPNRSEATDTADIAMLYLRDALLQACGVNRAAALDPELIAELTPLGPGSLLALVEALLKAREALGRNSNVRLTLDVLMLDLATVGSRAHRQPASQTPGLR